MNKYIEWIDKQIEVLRSEEAFKNRIEPEFTITGKKLIYFKCIKDYIEHSQVIHDDFNTLIKAITHLLDALNISYETINDLKNEGKISLTDNVILSSILASKYLAEYGINPDDE